MIIIGEKINGAIPSAAAAIESRDEAFIRKLARMQTETGAQIGRASCRERVLAHV